MTSVAEGCEVARKLLAICEQKWWAEADAIDNYRYPRGSGDYGAEDVDARPRIYEWRNLLPHGSAIPPRASVEVGAVTPGKRAGERRDSRSPPRKRDRGVGEPRKGVFGTGCLLGGERERCGEHRGRGIGRGGPRWQSAERYSRAGGGGGRFGGRGSAGRASVYACGEPVRGQPALQAKLALQEVPPLRSPPLPSHRPLPLNVLITLTPFFRPFSLPSPPSLFLIQWSG